jgi:threonine dehydratase
MNEISLPKIRDAMQKIRRFMPPSSVKESLFLQKQTGARTYLKLENLNLSGAFKIRGALNALTRMTREELASGVIAASAGNHAQGIAYAARLMGSKATIFMPERAPLVKAEATRDLGAEVKLIGQSYDDALRAAIEFQKVAGGVFVHGFADYNVINGQGTVGLELMEQIPDLGMVIASIGGGGLMAGLATSIKALDPTVQIIGVQSKAYPAMRESFKSQRYLTASYGYTIADGIAIKEPAEITYQIISQLVDDIVLVDETEIASAIMTLMQWDHTLAEGSGAAPVAALAHIDPQRFAALGDKSLACVISGGNIDVNLLRRVIPDGLKSSGRLMRVAVRILDRPGRLAELLNLVGSTGANLQEVEHNRLYGAVGYENVEVVLDLETLNEKHQGEIFQALVRAGFKYTKLE